jgi:sodium-dependent dicarboxylate transporter 2/3/5
MLYPIALSVLAALSRLLERDSGGPVDATRLRFGTALMLGIAWAASIGGIVPPVGTQPNLVVLGQLDQLAGVRVPFFQWMLVGAPVAAVMLALLLGWLRWTLPPEVGAIVGSRNEFLRERAALGAPSRAEKNVLGAFALTVAFWVLPGLLALVLGSEAVRIDWGTLLLFGGGLSLGAAMFRTGLAEAIGQGIVRASGAQSLGALTVLFTLLAILLTETTSNTAAATMVGPLAIAAAQAAGVSPVPPAMGVALGASMAFMLPVSTPPNAIVYGSGCVPITVMLRLGTMLDLASALLVPAGVLLLTRLFGIG